MTKKKKVSIIIVSIILLLAVVGITLGVVLTRKQDPKVSVAVKEGEYYAGNRLSTVSIELVAGSTEGSVSWVNGNEVLKLGKNKYSYKFVAKQASKYKEVVGKIEVEAKHQNLVDIEVKTLPTKLSGYHAFDKFDTTGLVLKTFYDTGSINEVDSGFEVVYQTLDNEDNPVDSLRASDTLVKIVYQGKIALIELGEISKFVVDIPKVVGEYTYNGQPQKAVFATSPYYTSYNDTFTNAGDYKVSLTLTDPENCIWKNNSEADVLADFKVKKAEQTVVLHNFSGKYDANEHSAYVESENSTSIYYSFEQLTAANFNEGYPEVSWTNIVDKKVVYFYAVGNLNYSDKAGTLTITITKATPTVVVNDAFAVYLNKEIRLSENYAEVRGVLNEEVSTSGKITYEFYQNDKKVTPKNKGTYLIVANFAGNETYEASKSQEYGQLVIADEPQGFYAGAGESKIQWVNNVGYAEFALEQVNDSFKTIKVESTVFGNGRLVYDEGFVFESSNGKDYLIELSGDKNTITATDLSDSTNIVTLTKLVIPECIGTYKKTDSDGENTLRIFVAGGGIKFELSYKLSDTDDDGNPIKKDQVVTGAVKNVGNTLSLTISVSASSYPADYDPTNKTITIQRFIPNTNVVGEYTKVA